MQERLLWKSDAYRMSLCATCGRATCHSEGSACLDCCLDETGGTGGRASAVGVVVPYSFKLLLQSPGSRRRRGG